MGTPNVIAAKQMTAVIAPGGGELKGGMLEPAHLESLVEVLFRHDAVMHACAIDVSREEDSRIDQHKAQQCNGMTKHLTCEHHRDLVREVWDLRHVLDRYRKRPYAVALKLALYCETHARRTYAAGTQAAVDAAQAILKHIRKCDLADGFTARDLHQKDWSRLTDRDAVEAGLTMLVDYDWLAEQRRQTHGRGRPTTTYAINPRTWDENAPYSCHPQNPQNLYP
jgi:hypothetical protein